jgi:hypothetical protein
MFVAHRGFLPKEVGYLALSLNIGKAQIVAAAALPATRELTASPSPRS